MNNVVLFILCKTLQFLKWTALVRMLYDVKLVQFVVRVIQNWCVFCVSYVQIRQNLNPWVCHCEFDTPKERLLLGEANISWIILQPSIFRAVGRLRPNKGFGEAKAWTMYDNIDSQFGKLNWTCTHRMVLLYTKQVLHAEHSTLPKAEVGVQVYSDILIALDGFASKV